MKLTRTALSILQPFWIKATTPKSYHPKSVYFPCRTVATSKTRNMPGKKDAHASYPVDSLDHFLGLWCQTDSENMEKYLEKTGAHEYMMHHLKSVKSWTMYERDRSFWICTFGFMDTQQSRAFMFELGKPFTDKFIDETPMESVFYQVGKEIHETHEVQSKPKKVISGQSAVKDETTMISTLTIDGVTATKTFVRRADPEEIFDADDFNDLIKSTS